ncbi:MAG: polyprenyl synthetase family protein [Chloroflexota bacterium]|nr:polyprenyl synthetase family protein [Chloroflexota bacterium]
MVLVPLSGYLLAVTPDAFLDSVCASIEEAWRADGASPPSALLRWVTDAVRQSPFLRLPLLCCQATGGDPAHAIPIAAAWHLLHCAAHLLDDVEDQSLEPPLDPARVVNWATALTFIAQLLLLRPARWELPTARVLTLSEIFNAASLRICAAQDTDLAAGQEGNLSLDDYWRIAVAKGGTPLALACRAGAMLGTQPQTEVDNYATFGYHLGVLVQLGDDLHALWTPRGRGDLITAGQTLPVVYTLTVASSEARTLLYSLLHRALDDPAALRELQTLLSSQGALHYLTLQAGKQHHLAREALLSAARPAVAQHELLKLLDAVFPAVARERWTSHSQVSSGG